MTALDTSQTLLLTDSKSSGLLNRLSPQAVFILVAGFFGLAMAFVTPPVQAPDEPHHWYRIYQLTQGKLVSKNYGGIIPTSMIAYSHTKVYAGISYNANAKTSVQETLDNLKEPLNPRNAHFEPFPDCAIYPIVPYIPQTLAMLVARKMQLPALWLMYAGRIGTLLGYLLIGATAIRVTPILKWTACMVLTCPMALFLAGSLSEDPFTIATVFLATAMVLRCILLPEAISGRTALALGFVMVIVALCKSAYFPVSLLLLAVPRERWGKGHRKWTIPLGIILLSFVALVTWSLIIKPGEVTVHGWPGPKVMGPWLRAHPMEFLIGVRKGMALYGSDWFRGAAGELGWLDTRLHPGVTYLLYFALVWVTLNYDQPLKLPILPRLFAVIGIVGSAVLIITACFLYANSIESMPKMGVTSVQGRYFLPLAMLIGMVFRRQGRYVVQPKWMLAFLSTISLYTLWILVERYYLPVGYLGTLMAGNPVVPG